MIKVALLGCGRVAKRHAAVLGGEQVQGARLAAVCDIVDSRAMEIGKRYRVPWYTDATLMMETATPDLVSILTPSGLHVMHTLFMSTYGLPILVEKPLALTLEGVDAVTKACEDIPVCEVKQNRYNVAVRHVRQAMEAGRLGRPRLASVRVWWARDAGYYTDWHGQWSEAGGVLANQAIHHIDLLWWLLGDVKRVSAVATYDDYTEVETGLCATLEFESGCIGTVQATTLARPCDLEGSLAILGDLGTVELGGFAVNRVRRWEFVGKEQDDEAIRHALENPPNVYGFGHRQLYQDIVNRLNENQPMPVEAPEARKALEIIHAMYHSMETGKTVDLCGNGYKESRLGK